VAKHNKDNYLQEITLLGAYDQIKSTALDGRAPRRRMLCANEKEYMSSTHFFMLKILVMLKEEKQLFQQLMTSVDRMPGMPEQFLDNFAEDLVNLFFVNFTSNKRNILDILRHIESLMRVLLSNISYNT
jgi:hypothetical protein